MLVNRSATAAARLETDEQSARRIADLFAESYAPGAVAVALDEHGAGRWCVAMHFIVPPDKAAVRALTAAAAGPEAAKALRFERIAARDWVSDSLAKLSQVAAGRFVVHGAHNRSHIPANRIGIEIAAALAFGTGHHGTTRGCLIALDLIAKSQSKRRRHAVRPHSGARVTAAPQILDLGTGSGILGIAAAHVLRRRVLATDIDASAVRVARANARLNKVGTLVDVFQADGVAAQIIRARAPFGLIFANILLRPLQRLAAPLMRLTAPGSRVVLSGLLTAQANMALAAYRGLALELRIEVDGWTTLVLVRRNRPRSGVAGRRAAS